MKKSNINFKVKKWLNRNKIYFETICATFLTLMAVIVSLSSYLSNIKQITNQELLNEPVFKISLQDADDIKSLPGLKIITIENIGIRVRLFDPQIYGIAFFQVRDSIQRELSLDICINDLSGSADITNNVVGKIAEFKFFDLKDKLDRIKNQFNVLYKNERLKISYIYCEFYSYVCYTDYKGEEKYKCYKIEKFGGIETDIDTLREKTRSIRRHEYDGIVGLSPQFIRAVINRRPLSEWRLPNYK